MGEPRQPTCLRGNPKVCPKDECPSQFLCTMKAKADMAGDDYDSTIQESIDTAIREYGSANV